MRFQGGYTSTPLNQTPSTPITNAQATYTNLDENNPFPDPRHSVRRARQTTTSSNGGSRFLNHEGSSADQSPISGDVGRDLAENLAYENRRLNVLLAARDKAMIKKNEEFERLTQAEEILRKKAEQAERSGSMYLSLGHSLYE